MKNLLENCQIVPAVVPTAGAVANLTPVEVDGRGFSKAVFAFEMGAIAATGKFNAKIQKAATSGGALADCTGAALTEIVAAGASKVYAIEVTIDPAKPFMKVTGAVTVDTAANSAVCLLHRGSGKYPKSAPATEAVLA